MNKLQKLSVKFLRFAEGVFLYAHGWRSLPSETIHGNFEPPTDFPFKKHPTYVRVHAVNAQRQVYAKETKELTGE
jgi:hypothetical protein